MRPNVIDIDVADANLTGFASNATGATWALSANVATDGLAHQISIKNDSATDFSGTHTITIVGLDPDGNAQTETITAPAGSATVESTGYYSRVTSVTPSATIGADTVDIGWVDEVSSATYPIDWRSPYACNIQVDVTGTINFTVQETYVDVLGGVAPVWANITALASKTADTNSTATIGATAIRVIVNSYSSGAELQMYTSQAQD